MVEGILRVDFTKGWANGLYELLRGIARNRQVVKLTIDKKHPLQLDTKDFAVWVEEYISSGITLLFVLDDHGLMDELSKMDREPCYDREILADLRYSNLLALNFCAVLPVYIAILNEMVYSKNYMVGEVTESVQTLFKLAFYYFYESGVKQAFYDGLCGSIKTLKSIDGPTLIDDIENILNESRVYKTVGRRTVAALLDISDPIDLGLLGKKGIRNMSHILISSRYLPDNIEENWQFIDLRPLYDISPDTWLQVCMPQIGAEHIVTISHDGESIVEQLSILGLKPSDYEKMGLA